MWHRTSDVWKNKFLEIFPEWYLTDDEQLPWAVDACMRHKLAINVVLFSQQLLRSRYYSFILISKTFARLVQQLLLYSNPLREQFLLFCALCTSLISPVLHSAALGASTWEQSSSKLSRVTTRSTATGTVSGIGYTTAATTSPFFR